MGVTNDKSPIVGWQIRLLYKIHSHKETNSVMVATGYNFSRSGQVLIGEYHTQGRLGDANRGNIHVRFNCS